MSPFFLYETVFAELLIFTWLSRKYCSSHCNEGNLAFTLEYNALHLKHLPTYYAAEKAPPPKLKKSLEEGCVYLGPFSVHMFHRHVVSLSVLAEENSVSPTWFASITVSTHCPPASFFAHCSHHHSSKIVQC